jgi:hypothetical protein
MLARINATLQRTASSMTITNSKAHIADYIALPHLRGPKDERPSRETL